MKNMDKVWDEYLKTKRADLREKLIIEYSPLVRYVAGRLSIHLGQHVEYEELISYGVFGLLDAIDKFDVNKGYKFETYASLRIRGEIIDNIRKMDWIPRTLRQKNKQIDTVYSELENILMRPPSDAEMAEKLDVTVNEYQDMLKKANISTLVSLDDYIEQNHDLPGGFSNGQDNPEVNFDHKEIKKILTGEINKLSEKEKKVVSLYYFEEFTLREISKIMGVSESRISQIHSKAVMKLQNKLGKYKYLLYS